ncbi:ATPase, T2SS/T4P/T4SS family [Aliikangiella sp. G2MR2-5]|uniref:ATPase, T2SS/T4P/T4SS family n=1 Tax=Aliikangiella sp. G2MR2-5 TaxID=2788943 RepID=UPI0018AC27C8|nr:ATPase, T2SS/T4P/T4SS family [Aliikangiella sp. G2MR2-5]
MENYDSLFTGKKKEKKEDNKANFLPEQYCVLLVDDEPAMLKSLQRCFRRENYAITLSEEPIEALKLIQNQRFHLVISDFKMPKMNGADFLREVKRISPETVRIMLTGHADTSAVMAAIKDGAVYKFILKPCNNDDLRVTVALALEQYELQKKNAKLEADNKKHQKDLSRLTRLMTNNRTQLLFVLNKKNLISDVQVQQLVKLSIATRQIPIKLLLDKGWVKESKVRQVIKQQFFIDEVLLNEFKIDPAVVSLIPASFCRKQLILPIKQQKKVVTLVMADPLDDGVIESLKFSSGLDFNIVMANCDDIEKKIKEVFSEGSQLENYDSLISQDEASDTIEIIIEEEEDIELVELLEGTSEPPAIKLANALIMEAIRLNASDIHIQPTSKYVIVRLRIDGVLFDKIHVPLSLHMPLVSRIKIMAELDITERRRPQDGRITVKSPLKIVDLRLSTLPTINGEKIVMRLLDRNSSMLPLPDLGFTKEQLDKLELISTKPQGIILTTGPTGSGKTTTLYSLLQSNANSEKNYITIEDPVEYYMDRAVQVMVKEKINLNFTSVLRAVLRQDPDTILLGEIRDAETADIAFQAALTGHVVYSTLHTNSAIATIARLFDFNMRPYVIASAIEAIVAQRLVRKLCQKCKIRVSPEKKQIKLLGKSFFDGLDKIFDATGCEHCQGSGLKGRIGIYELLIFSEDIRQAISKQKNIIEIASLAHENGLLSLLEDAKLKVAEGLISVDEVIRVLGAQDLD